MASSGRMLKLLLAIAGGLVGIALLAAVLLALLLPRDAIRDYTVKQAGRYLDRPLHVGDIGLALFPHVGAEVTDISIGSHPRLTDEPFLSIDRLVVSVGIWRLIARREVHVTEATVENPRVVYAVGVDGTSSLDGLLKEVPEEAAPKEAGSAAMPVAIQLDGFRIVGGSVSYDDRQAGRSARIASIDQRLSLAMDAAANRVVALGELALAGIEASLGENGVGPIDVSLDHDVFVSLAADTAAFDLALNVAGIPMKSRGTVGAMRTKPDVTASLQTGRIEIAQLLERLRLPPDHQLAKMRAGGAATLSAHIHAVIDSTASPAPLALDALLVLDEISLNHPDLPKALDRLSGVIAVTRDSVVVRGLSIRAGGSSIDTDAQVAGWQTTTPELARADVKGTVLLGELADVVELPDSAVVGGTISFRLAASGPVHDPLKMNVDGRISLANVSAASPDLPVPVTRLDGALDITSRRISIGDIGLWIGSSELHLAETSVTDYLGLVADQPGGRTPRVRFALRSPILSLDELIPESPPYVDDDVVIPAIALPPMVVDGTVRIDRILYARTACTDLRAVATVRGSRAEVEGTAIAFAGTAAFGGGLDLSTPDRARYSGRWDVKQVQADALVSTFTDHDGRLHGTAFTSGGVDGSGNTWRDVKRNLTMSASFRAGNGYLNNWEVVKRTSAQVAQAIDRVRPGLGAGTVQRMGLGGERFTYGQLDGGASLESEVLHLSDIGVRASEQDWRIDGTIGSAFDTVSALDLSAHLTFSEEISRELAAAAAGAISLATPVTGEEIARHLEPANRLRIALPVRGTTAAPDVGTPDLMAPYRRAAENAVRAKAQQVRQQAEKEVGEQATEAVDQAKKRLRGILKK